MTVETTPPAFAGTKPVAVGLAGAALGLSAFGTSAAIVSYSPGGTLTASDQGGDAFQAIDFDLTDLGSISSSVVDYADITAARAGITAGHLYLWSDRGIFSPFAKYGTGNGFDGTIAKSSTGTARIFEAGELIDADAFGPASAATSAGIFNLADGLTRYIGFAIGLTDGSTAQYGWVEFTLGSISNTGGLAINTTNGQGLCAGTTNAAGSPSCAPVPVPPSLALLATGMAGLAAVRRRRKLDA
jgi:hypothetical protein